MNKIHDCVLYAIKNRKDIEKSKLCGCYHCTEIFAVNEITQWTDQNETAICPKCAVDAVVPDAVFFFDKDLLIKAQKYWF